MTRQDFKNKTLIFSLKIVSDKIKIPTSLSRFWNHQTWTRVNINPQTSMSQNHHEVRSFKMYYHQVFIDLVSASQRLKQGPNTSAKSRFAVTRHPLLNPHLQRLQHVSSKAWRTVSSQESLIHSWKEKNRFQTQNDCSTVTKWSQWHQLCWICQLLSSTLQFVTTLNYCPNGLGVVIATTSRSFTLTPNQSQETTATPWAWFCWSFFYIKSTFTVNWPYRNTFLLNQSDWATPSWKWSLNMSLILEFCFFIYPSGNVPNRFF